MNLGIEPTSLQLESRTFDWALVSAEFYKLYYKETHKGPYRVCFKKHPRPARVGFETKSLHGLEATPQYQSLFLLSRLLHKFALMHAESLVKN